MDTKDKIALVAHRAQMHGGIPAVLRADEAMAGRAVVRPGEAPWLPTEDWHPDTVVSVEDDRARLVLLAAVRPGAGAFTRLIRRLGQFNLKPVVVEPTPQLAAALERRRWRSRTSATETIWYPRRRA